MRFVGRGHPAVRATHGKTIELTPDDAITERATCVIAVGCTPPPRPLAGALRLTITAGVASFSLTARGNPSWDPAGPAVIRRSALRLAGTFATHSDAAARDLPRALVAGLRDPERKVTVDVEPIPGPPTAVLFALDPQRRGDDARLAAELAAADLIVAEDDTAARLLGERVTRGPVRIEGRTLAVASEDLPGATVVGALRDVEIETGGLPPTQAAAAASPSRGPVLYVPAGTDPRTPLRSTPAGTRIVLTVPAPAVCDLLQRAADLRGVTGAVLVEDFAPPRRISLGDPEPAGDQDVHLCLDAPTESAALDPSVRAAIDALLADGVPTRTAAKALAALTGWERRRAYDTVLNWTT